MTKHEDGKYLGFLLVNPKELTWITNTFLGPPNSAWTVGLGFVAEV